MEILEDKSLAPYSSLKIGGNARFIVTIDEAEEAENLHNFSIEKNLPLLIIGKGTNSLFPDKDLKKVIGIVDIKGITIIREFDESIHVEVGAGENWDEFVEWSVKNNFSGLEALSAIPGTVGASPIQNIGAYGSELKDTFVNVHAYDTETKMHVVLGISDCEFGYRDSIFKRYPGRFIILKVIFELSKNKPAIPKYRDVQLYFVGHKKAPSLKQIRKAIIEIRHKKLPDPETIPNAGSFFKNPILDKKEAEIIIKKHPKIPNFEMDNGDVKIYAGWLIENAGFKKGQKFNKVSLYKNNALVLTTEPGATFYDVMHTKKEIEQKVKKQFGILLEMEPTVIE